MKSKNFKFFGPENLTDFLKKAFLMVLMLILLVGLTYAVPGIPHQFFGTVTINGASASDGTKVTATVDGVTRGQGTTSGGIYGYDPLFKVLDPNNLYGTYNPQIKFYVNGAYTGKTATFIAGENTQLDLSVTISSGGGSSSSGGGGSGGGGGSLFGSDLWDCEEWSKCIDGKQTQKCTQGDASKTNERECDVEDDAPDVESMIPPTSPEVEKESGEDEALLAGPGAPPITGAVVAEESDKSFLNLITGNWLIPFLAGIIIVLLILVLVLTGRRKKKEPEAPERWRPDSYHSDDLDTPIFHRPEPRTPEPTPPQKPVDTSSTSKPRFDNLPRFSEIPDIDDPPSFVSDKDEKDFF